MKKNRELLNIIGDVDEDMIEKARPDMTKKKIRIWPGIVSMAAVLALIAGIQYRYIFMPLADNKKSSMQIENTSVESTFAVNRISEQNNASDVWDLKKVNTDAEDCIVKELYTNDDGNLWVSYEGSYSSGYLALEYGGVRYDFNEIIEGNLMGGPLNVCASDDHIFVHYQKALYSAEISDHKNVYSVGGEAFHSEQDLGGATQMLGTDSSGNVYMLNSEFPDRGKVYHLFCYSPDLKVKYFETSDIIHADTSGISDREDIFSGIFDTACGFDEMHISGKSIEIKYAENCMMRYDFENGKYSSDMNFNTELREADSESGIYRDGWYTEAEDENGVIVLKICTYRVIDNADNHDRTADGGKIYTCFDSEAVVDCFEKKKVYLHADNFDCEGNRLSDTIDLKENYVSEEQKGIIEFYDGKGVLAAAGLSADDVPEKHFLKSFAKTDEGVYMCVFYPGDYYAEVNYELTDKLGIIVCAIDPSDADSKTAFKELDPEITNVSPQKDGTFVYTWGKSLYSFEMSGKTTKICDLGRDYITSEKIVKLDDDHYALPHAAFDSLPNYFYLLEKP